MCDVSDVPRRSSLLSTRGRISVRKNKINKIRKSLGLLQDEFVIFAKQIVCVRLLENAS